MMRKCRTGGFTLLEILVSLLVFGILGATIYSAYVTQMQHTSREYVTAQGDMELEIAKNILERDIVMAGFGLADDFSEVTEANGGVEPVYVAPARGIAAANGVAVATVLNDQDAADELILTGTGLGLTSRVSQAWSASVTAPDGTRALLTWDDPRENFRNDDNYIAIDNPFTKKLDAGWPYIFDPSLTVSVWGTGTVLYGVSTDAAATFPYTAVRYYLGGSVFPAHCAAGTVSLLRASSRDTATPGNGDPFFSCVLNMQVVLGLDTDDDHNIDMWDEGGVAAAALTQKSLRKQLKQVRVYILMQNGNRDESLQGPASMLVGDAALGIGQTITFDTAQSQEKYRWKLVTISVTPRNLRS
jgi:prepilin-type N-terminal cleavage/methylation domain-containing protein